MKLEPVIIVHGTFSQESGWYRRGSDFCRILNAQLQQRGSRAQCWSHLSSESDEFQWSGANSEIQRRLAAWELLNFLATLERRSDVEGYHIIAHSHGGNVVMNALALFSLGKLRTVTFLGCPFIEMRSRFGYLLLRSTLILLTVWIVSLALVRTDDPDSFGFFTFLLLGASFWFAFSVLANLSTLAARFVARRKYRGALFKSFVMHSQHDEAYAALVASTEVSKKRGYHAKMLMRRYEFFPTSDYWNFKLFALNLHIPLFSTSRLRQSLVSASRILNRPMRVVNRVLFGMVSLPLTLVMYSARYLGLRTGLGALTAVAIGDDFGRERIESFARRPSHLITTDLEVPTTLDNALMDQAVLRSSEVLRSVYELLSTPSNVAEVVHRALTDPYLIHSQYYKHEQLICLIASVIAGSGEMKSPIDNEIELI